MARARQLKPSFFTNEALSTLPTSARLLFSGLWTIADREGRLEDRPSRIKVELLPYDRVKVDVLLQKLHEAGFIARYESGENKYIQIVNFTKHQHVHPNEAASTIPEPQLAPSHAPKNGLKLMKTDLQRDRAKSKRRSGSANRITSAETEANSPTESGNVTSARVKEDTARARITSTSTSSSDPSDRHTPAAPSPRQRFFKSGSRGKQIGALIDEARAHGYELDASHVGGMLKRYPKGAVWDALVKAQGDKVANYESRMEDTLSDAKRKHPSERVGEVENVGGRETKRPSPFAGMGKQAGSSSEEP